jgi:hypothetical protein
VRPRRYLALALLTLAAAYGCSGKSDDPAGGDQEEDQLILRKGSVDHAGIVEASTMMLAGGPTDGVLDPYNQEDPFGIRAETYVPTFAKRLAQFDGIDGKTDWQPDQITTWTSRVAAGNYLVVDTSMPCDFADPHTYLEIERAQLTGRDHATCGGRMPNEDALDVTLNFLVRGPAASVSDDDALHDGVEQATQKSADSFPYLAEMNGL